MSNIINRTKLELRKLKGFVENKLFTVFLSKTLFLFFNKKKEVVIFVALKYYFLTKKVKNF